MSERDQTLLASSPTHGWFTGKLIKCCSSLSKVHDSSSSCMDKLLLKPMITFLHLATKHNRMWLLALRAWNDTKRNMRAHCGRRKHSKENRKRVCVCGGGDYSEFRDKYTGHHLPFPFTQAGERMHPARVCEGKPKKVRMCNKGHFKNYPYIVSSSAWVCLTA